MSGNKQTATIWVRSCFRHLRSTLKGLRRGGAGVDAYHHRRRHGVPVPSRINRKGLLKVFDVAISALRFFERRGANPVHTLQETIGFQGVRTPFLELRDRPANAR